VCFDTERFSSNSVKKLVIADFRFLPKNELESLLVQRIRLDFFSSLLSSQVFRHYPEIGESGSLAIEEL